MTKKDYILISNVIRVNKNYSLMTKVQIKAIDNLAHALSHCLYLDNNKFDERKFLKACTVE